MTYQRHGGLVIVLHWLIALLIIGNFIGASMAEDLFALNTPEALQRGGMIIGLHKASGITVLVLTLLLLLTRLGTPRPALPAHMTGFERGLARFTHVGLYALMLGMPLAGWAMSSASPANYPISWFGLFEIPQLPIADSKDTAGLFNQLHGIGGWVLLALAALHLFAALKHHFGDRDAVLARMLPLVRPRQ